ncbi:MAG TPA: hypothetical protein VGS57_20395 [Thermoanaerobaculia bacterium]|nr:hypothetical protein [Thermoanaerobaculia bacterium]
MKKMSKLGCTVVGAAALAFAACSATAGAPRPMVTPDQQSKRQVEITVFHDLHVDPDPVSLSKSGNFVAHWKLDGGGTLGVESKSEWPMKVDCDGAECTGKIKANGRGGRYEYRVVVNGKAGDPVLIITD